MSLDGQMERLCALYDEKSDDELQRMYEDRDDLTEVAQQALAETMRARGMEGRSQLVAVEAPAEGEELGSAELGVDEVMLYTFGDAFEAGAAVRVLEEAGVWQRLATYTPGTEGRNLRMPVGLTVIVRRADLRSAVELMRAKMGLFPKAEVGDGLASPLAGMEAMVLVAMFDRGEGLIAAESLGRAGISYCWRDGADESQELPDEQTVAIEVAGGRLEEANGVVEAALAERPEA
jgi:hypothetical protein